MSASSDTNPDVVLPLLEEDRRTKGMNECRNVKWKQAKRARTKSQEMLCVEVAIDRQNRIMMEEVE